MRLTTFDGIYPKLDGQDLPPQAAVFAENCDLYGGRIDPFPALGGAIPVVDVYGNVYTGEAETLYKAGPVWVAFDKFTHVVPDVSKGGGEDGFLFTQNGKLWRSSSAWIASGKAPQELGISPPELPPQAALMVGAGTKEPTPALPCDIQMGSEDCNPDAAPPEIRSYLMTYVVGKQCDAAEQESAPSPPSEIVEARDGDTVVLVDPNIPPANATHRRWYRAVAGTEGKAIWLLVGESPINQAMYTDDVSSLALGRAMDTESHLPPPCDIEGVALMGNMDTVVWSGDQFWVSEPRMPHTYPPVWRRQLMFDIVTMRGVTQFSEGNTHYIGYAVTKGKPYFITGALPEEISAGEIQAWEPAMSAKGVTEVEGGIVYASRYGLILVAGNDVKRMLDPMTTDIEWNNFDPRNLHLHYWNGRLWGFGPLKSFVVPYSRYREDRRPMLTYVSLHPTAAFAAADTPLTLMVGGHAFEWGAGDGYMRATWRSRTFTTPGHWWPAAMKVVADFPLVPRKMKDASFEFTAWRVANPGKDPCQFFLKYPKYREFEGALLTAHKTVRVKLYSDGREILSRHIKSSRPFRTPRTRRGLDWEFEISTYVPVREVHLETTIQDLTQLGMGVGNSV